MRVTWLRHATKQGLRNGWYLRTGYPQHTDTGRTGCTGNRGNRLGGVIGHDAMTLNEVSRDGDSIAADLSLERGRAQAALTVSSRST
jgi:hypothetical protein